MSRHFDLPEPPSRWNASKRASSAGLSVRISPKKNLLGLLEALKGVVGDVRLTVFGPIEDASYWRECSDCIRELPPRSASTTVELFPTTWWVRRCPGISYLPFRRWGNFGHVIVEALMASCPVLTTDATPWADVETTGAGSIVRATDTVGITAALQRHVDCNQTRGSGCQMRPGRSAKDAPRIRKRLRTTARCSSTRPVRQWRRVVSRKVLEVERGIGIMRALVTGGAGFIGSNIVAALVGQGHEVIVLDNLLSGHRSNLEPCPSVRFLEGDIRDSKAVRDAVRGCEVVFHLAASVGNKRSIDVPMDDAEMNVLGTLRVLEAARKPVSGRLSSRRRPGSSAS